MMGSSVIRTLVFFYFYKPKDCEENIHKEMNEIQIYAVVYSRRKQTYPRLLTNFHMYGIQILLKAKGYIIISMALAADNDRDVHIRVAKLVSLEKRLDPIQPGLSSLPQPPAGMFEFHRAASLTRPVRGETCCVKSET
jgi:hypothetical protein